MGPASSAAGEPYPSGRPDIELLELSAAASALLHVPLVSTLKARTSISRAIAKSVTVE